MISHPNTTYLVLPNAVNDTIDSRDSLVSSAWRVENIVLGVKFNLGTGTNTSDVGYNPFTKRFGFIRNNFGTVSEIAEADIVNSVTQPPIIRTITLNGMFGDDSEGLSDVFPNLLEGGYEFWSCIENGGRTYGYNFQITESEMFSVSDISLTARRQLQFDQNAADTNLAGEGIDYSIKGNELLMVREGGQPTTTKKVYLASRPTDRDTDYSYSDAEFNPSNPFDGENVTGDLSSCAFHEATGHLLILSDTGNAVYQYDRSGTLISTLSLGGLLFQPEGICMHGDNLVIMGETDECAYCIYVAP